MKYEGVAVLLVVSVAFVNAKIDKYCSICGDHTLCRYEGTGSECKGLGEGGVSQKEKKLILDLHNHFRRLVAKGQEKRGLGGRQPKAANLMKLTWDDELARIAQAWADQCTFQHDSCRDVSRWKVGQNLYWSWRSPITRQTNWTAAISSWYEEVEKFDPKIVKSYKFDAGTGHYTQLIWHDTTYLGCGRRNYGPNKIYVCNYGPAGNWINDPIYTVGEACSKCPAGTKCDDGLCAGSVRSPARKSGSHDNFASSFRQAVVDLPPSVQVPQDSYGSSDNTNKNEDSTAQRLNLIQDSSLSPLEETTTTEIPVNYNIIGDLDIINTDEDIKREIEALRARIHELTLKIIQRQIANH